MHPGLASLVLAKIPAEVDSLSLEVFSYLRKELPESAERGVKIQVLLLCNPHNPLPQVVPREVVQEYALFAEKVRYLESRSLHRAL